MIVIINLISSLLRNHCERTLKVKFDYTGIRVKDMEKSVDFYTKVLGMKVVGKNEFSNVKGRVVSLQSEDGGPYLELNYYQRGSKYNTRYAPGEELDHLAFKVEDIDGFLASANRMGYPKVAEMKTEKEHWAYIKDPNGIWIEIVH
jgi:lactoylglutathione lyase